MKGLITLSILALLSTNAEAKDYCHAIEGNWINTAPTNCPPFDDSLGVLQRSVKPNDPPPECVGDCEPPPECTSNCEPPPEECHGKSCDEHENHGHGNGDEGDCSGSGCTDPDNPGHGPKN